MHSSSESSGLTYATLLGLVSALAGVFALSGGTGYLLARSTDRDAPTATTSVASTITTVTSSGPVAPALLTSPEALNLALQNAASRLLGHNVEPTVVEQFTTSYHELERTQQTPPAPMTSSAALTPEAAADFYIRSHFGGEVKATDASAVSNSFSNVLSKNALPQRR